MKVLLLTFSISLITLSSCNKCHDCHWDNNGTEVEIGELCGDELEDAEANGYTVGDTVVTIHCEEH
jgi:hypothetical protein